MLNRDPKAGIRQQVNTDADRAIVKDLGLRTILALGMGDGETKTFISGDDSAAKFQACMEGWGDEIKTLIAHGIRFDTNVAVDQTVRMVIKRDDIPKYQGMVFSGLVPHMPSFLPR